MRIDEFMEMSKELGISSWAHRHKIKRAIEEKKSEAVQVVRDHDDDDDDLIEEPPNTEAQVENVSEGLEIEECELCKSSTQH